MIVVDILQKRSARNTFSHHLLRCFYFYSAFFQFDYHVAHIPSVLNTAADALSRNNMTSFFLLFLRLLGFKCLPHCLDSSSPSDQIGDPPTGYRCLSVLCALTSTIHSCLLPFGCQRYIQFCSRFHLTLLPLCQDNVVRFVASLALSGVSHSSIRSYLSGIRFLQLAHGLPDPCLSSFPLLGYVLRGIHRLPAPHPCLPRLPITPEILQMLFTSWSQAPQDKRYDGSHAMGSMLYWIFWVPSVRGIYQPVPSSFQAYHAFTTGCLC